MAQQLSTNTFGVAKWVVSADATQGTHTTIAGALTSASSGDTIFIRPGTYTENLTLKSGVNLAAFSADAETPNVTISGKCSYSGSGTVSISGIRLQTNSDYAVEITGANASIVNLINCFVYALNNSAIHCTSSNGSTYLSLSYCYGDFGANNAFFTWASASTLDFEFCVIQNTANSSTTSGMTNGTLYLTHTTFKAPITVTSFVNGNFFNSVINTGGSNSVCLTTATSGSYVIYNSYLRSGTGAALSIGSGTTVYLANSVIESNSASQAILGSGTLQENNITYIGSNSTVVNTVTQTMLKNGPLYFDTSSTTSGLSFDGTNFLKSYVEAGSWTPGISFGGGNTGITYTSQFGEYTRVGNLLFYNFAVVLSNKGSSTGNAAVTGLPVSHGASTADYQLVGNPILTSLPAGTSNVVAAPSGTTLSLFGASTTAAGLTNLTNAHFGNTSQLTASGFYFIS